LPDRACGEQCFPEHTVFHDQRIGRVEKISDVQHHLVPNQSAGADAERDDARWHGSVGHANCAVSRFGLGLAVIVANNIVFDDGCDARTRDGERQGSQRRPIGEKGSAQP